MVPILILAAGASSRMAPLDKLTQEVDGVPLLRRTVLSALDAAELVLCTLPIDSPARHHAIDGLPVARVEVPDAASGLSASLRAGINALPAAATGVLVLPADMPGLRGEDLRACLDAFARSPTRIVRATDETGRPGHPAVFPSDLFGALCRISGDEGGRSVLSANRDRVDMLALPGNRATLDLDTPGDWVEFRRRGALLGGQ